MVKAEDSRMIIRIATAALIALVVIFVIATFVLK